MLFYYVRYLMNKILGVYKELSVIGFSSITLTNRSIYFICRNIYLFAVSALECIPPPPQY